jgi:hypothetical protein
MKPRILPADVYDTLELSALAYGGIGAGHYFDYGDLTRPKAPRCAFGHAYLATTTSGRAFDWAENQLTDALTMADISPQDNDAAVGAAERIPFAEWCRRLNVVRGAA